MTVTIFQNLINFKIALVIKLFFQIAQIEFFAIALQYKNGNIANFILALPLQINWSNKACNVEI